MSEARGYVCRPRFGQKVGKIGAKHKQKFGQIHPFVLVLPMPSIRPCRSACLMHYWFLRFISRSMLGPAYMLRVAFRHGLFTGVKRSGAFQLHHHHTAVRQHYIIAWWHAQLCASAETLKCTSENAGRRMQRWKKTENCDGKPKKYFQFPLPCIILVIKFSLN